MKRLDLLYDNEYRDLTCAAGNGCVPNYAAQSPGHGHCRSSGWTYAKI